MRISVQTNSRTKNKTKLLAVTNNPFKPVRRVTNFNRRGRQNLAFSGESIPWVKAKERTTHTCPPITIYTVCQCIIPRQCIVRSSNVNETLLLMYFFFTTTTTIQFSAKEYRQKYAIKLRKIFYIIN